MPYDAVILGGGPAGLSAALTLGRGRKRVLLCDAGPRRNAAAVHVHNFVTRDGTPPEEFRRVARQQLAGYPNVEVRDLPVESVTGTRGAFRVGLGGETVGARRVVLCTGMVDEMLPIDGFRELWGTSIFQCPYCHGWEIQDQAWGYLATSAEMLLHFAVLLTGWTRDVALFKAVDFPIPEDVSAKLSAAGIRIEATPVSRLAAQGGRLEAVILANGERIQRHTLFAHPAQRQVAAVAALNLTLDDAGYVVVDGMSRETSTPGIYAAGDLTTRMQAAVLAAATGMQAGAMVNHELTQEAALQPTS